MFNRLFRSIAVLLFVAALSQAATLPSPEQFAGFKMGTDKKLIRWDKIVEYMKLAGSSSPRVKFEEVGKTAMGNPFITVTISSPDTVSDLGRYKANQRRLAYPRDLEEAESEKLIATNKAVMFITCNIHGSEIGSTQMAPELVYRLATEDSPEIKHILDNVIFVLIPSLNPDGQTLITDWYMKNAGTPWESSPLPELYHKYAGHDNNRDAFMNTQVESQHFNKLAFKEWFPVVYLDEHQMGNAGPRIFVPPFMNPINMNVDPTIWELNGMFGYAMGTALHAKGYTGIVNDTQYTSWWQGGFMMQVWWHNAIGLLTEVASANIASPTDQEKARPGAVAGAELTFEQQRGIDPRKPLPAPRDVTPRNTYPRPWMGGHWTLRNIVDYELTATFALLNSVANERTLVQRNFYRLNRKQIEMGKTEGPYAYVIPADQHDTAAAALMVRLLDEQGGEVHKATAPFQAGTREYPAGSYVVLMSQPFRPFVKDLLEKQTYPVQRQYPGGPIQRPYDVTGWTLPLQMGVEAVEVAKPFSANLEKMSNFRVPAGKFEPGSSPIAYEIAHDSNNATIVTNRLLKAGAIVSWTSDGRIVARDRSREDLGPKVKEMAQTLGVSAKGISTLPPDARRLRAPRIALYFPPQGVMDEGWTRWLLEQYEFPYTRIRPNEIKAGKLRDKYDAILFANQPKDQLINGATQEWIRPEDRGGIGVEGIAALKQFVRDGGSLVALGSSGLMPLEEFPLPLKNALKGLRPDQFSCPGSILKIFVDNKTPAGYGMPETASAQFNNNIAFDLAPAIGEATVHVIARYPASGILESGWIGGEEYLDDRIAAAQVDYGKGHVFLLGFAVQNRAQPHGTFKLLFNALHFSAAE